MALFFKKRKFFDKKNEFFFKILYNNCCNNIEETYNSGKKVEAILFLGAGRAFDGGST